MKTYTDADLAKTLELPRHSVLWVGDDGSITTALPHPHWFDGKLRWGTTHTERRVPWYQRWTYEALLITRIPSLVDLGLRIILNAKEYKGHRTASSIILGSMKVYKQRHGSLDKK